MKVSNTLLYKQNKNAGFDIHINMTSLGIVFFVLFITTYKSFVLPSRIGLILLTLSIIFLFSSILLNKNGLTFSIVDFFWLFFFVLFLINISFNNLINISTVTDIYVYAVAIFLLIALKVDVDRYGSAFKLITIGSVIYALSVIFHYMFTEQYMNYILPLFNSGEQESILRQQAGNYYNGFASQVAYAAGYIVSGIGIIIFSNRKLKSSKKFFFIFILVIMFLGLMLTTKRAHFIFPVIAILLTIILSLNKKIFFKSVLRITVGALLVIFVGLFIYTSIDANGDSALSGFVREIDSTIYGIMEGEDITSGRTTLYSHAWELFKQHPIVGIGWKEFRNNSSGISSNSFSSHPHNIYLQLLTEFGLIGFSLFMLPFVYTYYITFQLLRKVSLNGDSLHTQKWKSAIQYSFFYQTFFILYGMTGNLLTDYSYLLMYFFVCSIAFSAMAKFKNIKATNV